MPTASVLHYATECFEGLKLYRGYDSRLRLFRPDCNARRMLHSATRIALPEFDPAELQKLIETLCAQDGEKWLPRSRPGSFLYLRPTMIATADNLGVQKPKEALLYVIACCFPCLDAPSMGSKPGMKLLASREDTVRAWPGGFGFAKVGANYGPSLIAQAEARERGFDQVLWLLGKESGVTEAGASNFFVVWRTREGEGGEGGRLQLVTAPLEGKIILDGVTRRSVLQIARERLGGGGSRSDDVRFDGGEEGLEVVERTFTMAEIEDAVEEGRLVEAFACGTAVSVHHHLSTPSPNKPLANGVTTQFFICPVSQIHFRGKNLQIPMSNGTTGKYAGMMRSWLEDIMYGREQHEWGVVINEKQLDA